MTDTQYFIDVEKGFSVTYGNKDYRVQDDGKGWLHIIVTENNKRTKISIDKIPSFEPGSEADWAINGWWRLYPDYKLYRDYARAESAWLTFDIKFS